MNQSEPEATGKSTRNCLGILLKFSSVHDSDDYV